MRELFLFWDEIPVPKPYSIIVLRILQNCLYTPLSFFRNPAQLLDSAYENSLQGLKTFRIIFITPRKPRPGACYVNPSYQLWRSYGTDLVMAHAVERDINDGDALPYRGFETLVDILDDGEG